MGFLWFFFLGGCCYQTAYFKGMSYEWLLEGLFTNECVYRGVFLMFVTHFFLSKWIVLLDTPQCGSVLLKRISKKQGRTS